MDALRTLSGDLLLTLAIGAVFLVLLAVHRRDLARRRRRVGAIRATGEYGDRRAAVAAVLEAAAGLDQAAAIALAEERRRAFAWDPRLDKEPKAARRARDRAFASERDDVARAAAEAARDAAVGALAGTGTADRQRKEAAEAAAEVAAAIVAADRITAVEFKMLTRAWRVVVGPIGASPRHDP